MATKITERAIFYILGVFLLFLLINFDQNMALIFSLMIIVDYIIYKDDSIISYPFERSPSNRVMMFFEVIVVYGLFMLGSALLFNLLTPVISSSVGGLQTILELQASTKPALAGNAFLTLLGWGIIIPIIETRFFFARLLELLRDKLRLNPQVYNGQGQLLAVFLGALFALFHLTARQCGSAATCQNTALLVTFVFGYVSVMLVLWKKESKQATLLHIVSNTIAVLVGMGAFSIIGVMG